MIEEDVRAEPRCGKCGAEIRAGSQFCYGCGEKVAEVVQERIASKPGVRTFEAAKNGADRERQRPRRVRPEPKVVEVVWKRTDGTGAGILFIALGIALVVALLLGTAYYLK